MSLSRKCGTQAWKGESLAWVGRKETTSEDKQLLVMIRILFLGRQAC